MFGRFSDLEAEAVERDVDVYANTISKAVKFFEREQKDNQAGEKNTWFSIQTQDDLVPRTKGS
jgi:hypothetical protein